MQFDLECRFYKVILVECYNVLVKKDRVVSKSAKQKELKRIVDSYFSKNPQTKKLLESYNISAEKYSKAINTLYRSPLQINNSSTVNYE